MVKILVIDDNIEIRETNRFYYDTEGIECNIISNGLEGLKEIRKHTCCLILLDEVMPTYSGTDVVNF